MQYGTVKRWDPVKGFGFITTDEDEDLFVHAHDLDASVPGRQLKPGQRVGFDVRREMKGDRAVRVRVMKG